MNYIPIHPLHTPRLLLRRLTIGDAPEYFSRLGGSEAVTRYMLFRPHKSLSESLSSIEKALRRYETGEFYRWGIELPGSGLIGVIDLLAFDREKESCSFAYMLAEEFWDRGYGTEALKAVLDFAFREMELKSVQADHFAENTASGAVMRKAGMIFQGTSPGKYEKDGIVHDAPRYLITREMWEARQR